MTLSQELQWRGLVNQTTFDPLSELDAQPRAFYLGVDPSADSMTIGNLAAIMMVKRFVKHGHKAYLLVGGATGMIGDPDGKAQERNLLSLEQISANKRAIAAQYKQLFGDLEFTLVDNYDWFKSMHYLEFLRTVGKHVPMRQMLSREFVQSRLGEGGNGISYAEFSYVLIQAYDFLYLNQQHGVSLQLCGSDQWGNSIAGVDLIRRLTGSEAHVYSMPLIVNKSTGKKFGKTEAGAVWLDAAKTSPTQFYQFWINADDEGVEDYLKVYTELDRPEIESIIARHRDRPEQRYAQQRLAQAVTTLVHGEQPMRLAETVTAYITGQSAIGDADSQVLREIRKELPTVQVAAGSQIADSLVLAGLAASKTEGRRLLATNAVALNGHKVDRETYAPADFQSGRLLLRRGKAFKDTALVELTT